MLDATTFQVRDTSFGTGVKKLARFGPVVDLDR